MPANAPFNSAAMLQAVVGLVSGLGGVQHAYTGVPEALDSRVNVYVTIGDLTPSPHANQVARREPQVVVTFCYRVAGAEDTAELTMCAAVDELTAAVYADRSIGGTTQNAVMDMRANTTPAYMAVAGAEYRRYAVVISGLQTTNTP